MVEELVVREVLTEQMIDAGKKLVERLDQSESDVHSALWFLDPDDNTWKMIVSSPLVETDGPKSFFKRILDANKIAKQSSDPIISLNDIRVSSTSDPLIDLLLRAISTEKGIHSIRFTKNTINGTFIEDSYIYRNTR